MTLAILDINDAGIDVFVDGARQFSSPGYAVMDGDTLLLGQDAADHARLLTRWSNHRFWAQLDLQPLANATRRIRHHGDLALAHLEQIRERLDPPPDEVILAVPSGYDRQQLGLLIAIARESGLPVRGLVESSVAAACHAAGSGRMLHLDIELHRMRLTVLERGVTLRHVESAEVADFGLHGLRERWAQVISNQFIQSIRFDPLHEAASEQALYSRLPQWLEARGTNAGQAFTIALAQGERSVTISTAQLSRACEEVYPLLVQHIRSQSKGTRRIPLLLSHRWRGFPGLQEALRLVEECVLVELPGDAVCRGVTDNLAQIRQGGDALAYVTSLTPAGDAMREATAEVIASGATHLLLGERAFAIGGGRKLAGATSADAFDDAASPQCTIYLRGRQAMLDNHADGGTLVNGTAVNGERELEPGDRIRIGEREFLAITVE